MNTQADTLVATESIKNIMVGLDKLISFENVYWGITIIEIVTGKEILFGTINDFGDLMEAIQKEWREAGEDSVWYNPSTWKLFDFIGDLQAQAVGIDRDEFDWSEVFNFTTDTGSVGTIDPTWEDPGLEP